MLKYSGDARTWSSCSTSSKDYRPLHNPPPLNSPYHRYGSLFARLELVDALVCFVYSMWSKEHSNDTCGRSNWQTQDAFIEWCKHKWNQAVDEREKVFHGFILMLEAFIWGRVYFKSSVELKKRTEQMKLDYDAAQQEQARKQASRLPPASVGSGGTPEMLPSPASIVSGSANSTPTNPNRQTGTPIAAGGPTASNHQPMPPTTAPVPKPQEIPPVTIPVGRSFIKIASDLNNDIARAHACAAKASPLFNISALAKHFPRTYARMVNTTLQADDESEPDIEDEEGELYWPGNFTSGSGVGWICHLGKSMIKEFGKPMGYVGIDGVIPKPRPTKQHDGRLRPPPPPADAHHAGITPNAEGSGAVKR
ncbi:hypothetical protein C8Q75DRAFT_716627 [Abortiporus biennis]|nr:hypothetical protein C8Q75DRAFT_716627 [Abortiporus biennis]